MKTIILTFFISIISFNSFSQESTTKSLDLNSLVELFDLTKDDTHAWLTKDDFFTHIADKEKYDGKVYGFNYNSDLKTSNLWLHKYYGLEEMYLIGKKDEMENILGQLKPHLVMSNLNDEGTLISSYSHLNKDFIVQINPKKPATIKIIQTPADQSKELKIKRHKNMTEQNK